MSERREEVETFLLIMSVLSVNKEMRSAGRGGGNGGVVGRGVALTSAMGVKSILGFLLRLETINCSSALLRASVGIQEAAVEVHGWCSQDGMW